MEKNNKAFLSGKVSPSNYASYIIRNSAEGKYIKENASCKMPLKHTDK